MENTNYSERIKSLRKSKGLTQQQLADETGLSLRTIQRIEKGTEEISGYSLKQISKVLDIPLEQIIMQNVNQISIDNNQTGSIKTLYLSSLFFILLPFLGFIIPALIGFTKENRNALYKKHLRFILLLQGIQSIIILCLFFFTLPLLLFQGTSTPQQMDIVMPSTISMGSLNTSGIILEQKDSIYILKNFNTIDSLQRNKVLQQKLIHSTKDSITFHSREYDTIASIIRLTSNHKYNIHKATATQEVEPQIENTKETNWFSTIIITLLSLYYILNISIIVVQVRKLNRKNTLI